MSETPNKHIVRHDDSNNSVTHGWHVKLRRRGRPYRAFFADSKYGGKAEALEAARARRDKIVAEVPGETTADRRDRMTQRNTSGTVGVRRIERFKHGYLYEAWAAQWTDDKGERQTITFSVNKYGEDEALELALLARDTLISDRTLIESERDREKNRRKRLRSRQAG